MRDFQGQLCFTNPVIMPLKILIVLAMFSYGHQQKKAFKGLPSQEVLLDFQFVIPVQFITVSIAFWIIWHFIGRYLTHFFLTLLGFLLLRWSRYRSVDTGKYMGIACLFQLL